MIKQKLKAIGNTLILLFIRTNPPIKNKSIRSKIPIGGNGINRKNIYGYEDNKIKKIAV